MMTSIPIKERVQAWRDLWYIFRRNIFLLTNGVIAVVALLLIGFGDTQAGIFLSLVLCINMSLGLGQDVRAWYALRKLQLLTAPRVMRVLPDGSEESVLTEAIAVGDQLHLKTGDEVPCDGMLLQATALEVNEGLLTGEATSFARVKGERLLAGSIVTAGSGMLSIETVFAESRIARMTEGIKSYSVSESPIQRSVNQVIQYSGYLLILVIVFIVTRGYFVHEEQIVVIKNIGALASTVVPQGLAFALTLLFAYGAAHLYRRDVLLQEVNATEKLGRIKNLCMDKTGTLTENRPTVERLETPPGRESETTKQMMSQYIAGAGDHSQTMQALASFVGEGTKPEVITQRAFSSGRSYGAMVIKPSSGKTATLVVGAPDKLLPHIESEAERHWFAEIEQTAVKEGKRMVALCVASDESLPDDVSQFKLSFLGVFILTSTLRPGIVEAISFFQKRGVHIRIISGDHPETVRSIARGAGVAGCDQVTTGEKMKSWTEADFTTRAKEFTIFARTLPEQKEKIIEALKQDGFTAMVGDGANDALAIKRADLGIAMFEGAPATRKLASVVLMKNSFTALPGGVVLAESIIENAEVFASIFFGTALSGLFLFLLVSAIGYPFPLTPLNITLINYFAVGFPGILVSYWTIRPTAAVHIPESGGLLKRIAPLTFWSALLQSLVLFVVFLLSPEEMKHAESNLFVVLASIVTGYIFFLFVPAVYRGKLTIGERRDMVILTLFEIGFLSVVFQIPFLLRFFEVIGGFPWGVLLLPFVCFLVYGLLQLVIALIIRHSRALIARVRHRS